MGQEREEEGEESETTAEEETGASCICAGAKMNLDCLRNGWSNAA